MSRGSDQSGPVTAATAARPVERIQRSPALVQSTDGYADANLPGAPLELLADDGNLEVYRVVRSGFVFIYDRGTDRYLTATEPFRELSTATLRLEVHVGDQAAELAEHERVLQTESGPSHGRSRHGFQTGWEGQLRRAKTKLTPDQPSDPLGTGRTISTWTTSGKDEMIHAPTGVKGNEFGEGDAIGKARYDRAKDAGYKRKLKPRKSGGPYAGGFFSPKHQNGAEAAAMRVAQEFLAWNTAEFEQAGWKPIEYFDVVLNEQPGGYGVSFSKGKGSDSAYVMRITDKSLEKGHASEHSLVTEAGPGVQVYLMLCAKVQLKRDGMNWTVLSSFPDNLAPGAAPIFAHGDDPWTGKVRASATAQEHRYPPPGW